MFKMLRKADDGNEAHAIEQRFLHLCPWDQFSHMIKDWLGFKWVCPQPFFEVSSIWCWRFWIFTLIPLGVLCQCEGMFCLNMTLYVLVWVFCYKSTYLAGVFIYRNLLATSSIFRATHFCMSRDILFVPGTICTRIALPGTPIIPHYIVWWWQRRSNNWLWLLLIFILIRCKTYIMASLKMPFDPWHALTNTAWTQLAYVVIFPNNSKAWICARFILVIFVHMLD